MITHAAMAAAPTIVYSPVSTQEGNTPSVISSEGKVRQQKNITDLSEAALPLLCASYIIRTKQDACYTKEHCAKLYIYNWKKVVNFLFYACLFGAVSKLLFLR